MTASGTPGLSFQARLRKIWERGRSKLSKVARQVSDDDDSDDSLDDGFPPWTRGADDEEFTAQINDILEEHSDIVTGHNRKQRKQLFRNLHQGYVDEYNLEEPMDTQSVSLPVKTEYKRQRHEARLQAAVDPFSNHKGGKKARKAMLAASKLNPEDLVSMVPNAIVDMASLEAQIRHFVDDIGGKSSMALPAMDKASRKKVHELAAAFGLSSQSKGKGVRRYTTLMKTTRTGIVKEGKVRAIMKRFGNTFDRAYDRKNGGGSNGQLPRHREGDEVGKEAPKIGESNIGFRMLASMGWSEGNRIGGNASVGIEAPVTAIIKNSKLGLELNVTNVVAGHRRIPDGFYVSVSIGDDHWRTSNNPMCPTSGVVEWNDPIDLPLDVSADANVQIYGSSELGNTASETLQTSFLNLIGAYLH
ncbi:hypothetical protein BU15DRAFT_79190 [Melanogaster broomeanus]|nr:hypothetical protein BU15DRAFT_79190 [Melanogaster broomeanus]